MRARGQIAYWKAEKNFGFIRSGAAEDDVFLHGRDIKEHGYQPRPGEDVNFRLTSGTGGKPKALDASFPSAAITQITRSVYLFSLFNMLVVAMTGLIIWVFFFRAAIFTPILIYLTMSIITYLAYLFDKRQAIRGKSRVPEFALHIFEFFCGWPGAFAAQKVIRHKSYKQKFRRIFRAIVTLHVAVWIYALAGGRLPFDVLTKIDTALRALLS